MFDLYMQTHYKNVTPNVIFDSIIAMEYVK